MGSVPPGKGKILIAEPFLKDPGFSRSVVLLCEHSGEGTIGFVLNQLTLLTLGDLVESLSGCVPAPDVYQGGPVQPDTLHILHRIPAILGGVEVAPGIYWGGSYAVLQQLVLRGEFDSSAIKLFLGYSGWSVGQLEREMKESSWLVGDPTTELVFENEPEQLWKLAIRSLGNNYTFLANMPVDPQLN